MSEGNAGAAELVIRPAIAADIAAASALLIDAWHATYDGIYGADKVDEISGRWHAVAMLLAQIGQTDTAFMIAEAGGRMLATSYAHRTADGAVMLDRLYVLPGAVGRGIGSALMTATMAAFPGAALVRLEVAPANARAIAFYRRHGFTKVGVVASCGRDSNMPADIYEKDI